MSSALTENEFLENKSENDEVLLNDNGTNTFQISLAHCQSFQNFQMATDNELKTYSACNTAPMYPTDILTNAMSEIIENSPSFVDCDETNPKLRHRQKKKEKKRTECINQAFSELRQRIPNVPVDTKLSKIKTLRLATSYIRYLTDIVKSGDPTDFRNARDFRADLKALRTRERRKMYRTANGTYESVTSANSLLHSESLLVKSDAAKTRGRTGWPQTVWQMELGAAPFQTQHVIPQTFYTVPITQPIYEQPQAQHEYFVPEPQGDISYFSPINRPTQAETFQHQQSDILPNQQFTMQNNYDVTMQGTSTYQWPVNHDDGYPKQIMQTFPSEFFEPTPMSLPPISLPPSVTEFQRPLVDGFGQNYDVEKASDSYTELQSDQFEKASEKIQAANNDDCEEYTSDEKCEITYISL